MNWKEKLYDALLTYAEENPKEIAQVLDDIIEKMVEEGRIPHSSLGKAINSE